MSMSEENTESDYAKPSQTAFLIQYDKNISKHINSIVCHQLLTLVMA